MHPATVSDQISRILRSQTFANKGQLRKLLEVLHKNLASQSTLKSRQVIQELWPAEIRTKRPADVATEMNRLRHALESYYNVEGTADSILINLPNRSSARDRSPEKLWIVAKTRVDGCKEDRVVAEPVQGPQPKGSGTRANLRARLKTLVMAAAVCLALGIAAYVSIRVLAASGQPGVDRLDASTLVMVNPNLNFYSTSSFTIEAWAFRTGATRVMHLLGKREGCSDPPSYHFYQMAIGTGGFPSDAFPLNAWTHAALTYNGNTGLQLQYLNGALISSGDASAYIGPNSAPLRIGTSGTCPPFEGSIDEVRIYSRVLSGAEIESIFKAGVAGKYLASLTPDEARALSRKTGAAALMFGVSEGQTPPWIERARHLVSP